MTTGRKVWWIGKVDSSSSDYNRGIIFAKSPKSGKVIGVVLTREEMEKIWDIVERSKKYVG